MKVAINTQYGGYRLSQKAFIALLRKKGYDELCFYKYEESYSPLIFKANKISEQEYLESEISNIKKLIAPEDFGDEISIQGDNSMFCNLCLYQDYFLEDRTDEDLIEVIEELGEEASTNVSTLKVVEIPDDVEFEINDYDGIESVHEKHRVWR